MTTVPRGLSIGIAYWGLALALAVAVGRFSSVDALVVRRLRWGGHENPLGIVPLEGNLSWAVTSNVRGEKQTAYQVLVANDRRDLAPGKADLWDSGKVLSSQSTNIEYAGKPPVGRQRAYWTVRAWSKDGKPSAWATPAFWEIGPYDEELKGAWIGRQKPPTDTSNQPDRSVSYLRKTFPIPSSIQKARLYASAIGVYELSVNGKPVSNDILAPGYTDYEKRTYFQTYDVTSLLRRGNNALGAILAGGFCGAELSGQPGACGAEPPRFLAVLEITLRDGSREVVLSDETWKTSPGPIVSSHLYDGESYDARLEEPGWDEAAFDDTRWSAVQQYDEAMERSLLSDPGPPIQVMQDLDPVALTEPSPNVFVFDLGQNIVGRARLKLRGPAGTLVTLRFAEALNPNGTLYTENLRRAQATDRYTLRGQGREAWEPRFTIHGFRYVELSGLKRSPGIGAIQGRVIHSAMAQTGEIETSNPLINRLFSNIVWSERGAFLSVPMTGPERDERLGSLAEAQVFAHTACLNLDTQNFFRKWAADLRDAERDGDYSAVAPRAGNLPGGSGAIAADAIIPWAMHECYDDRVLEASSLSSITRRVESLRAVNPDFLATHGGSAEWSDRFESGEPTDPVLANTAYFAHSADLLGRIYRAGGFVEEANKYESLFEAIRGAFNRAFVSPSEGRLKSDSETAYTLAIRFNLLSPPSLEQAGQRLVEAIERNHGQITTGIFGTAELLPALSSVGRDDVAYRLLLNETCPSWLCSIKNGATTVWERWDGFVAGKGFADASSNSFNYYAFGAVGAWMYDVIGGIELDAKAPAGKHVFIHPRPGGGLSYAYAKYESSYGPIETNWRLGNSEFHLTVSIPAGSTATVTLPFGGAPTESGEPIRRNPFVKLVAGSATDVVVEIESGRYEFAVPIPPSSSASSPGNINR